MQPSNQHNPQGFGWFGGENQFGNQYPNNNDNNGNGPATFPKTPSLFLPNFVPPVYFPSAPYPTFPNFNFNQFPFAPPYNNNPNSFGQGNNQGNQHAGGNNQFSGQSPSQRPEGNGEGEFQGQGNNQNGGNQYGGQAPLQPGQGNRHQGQSPQYPAQYPQHQGQDNHNNNGGGQFPQPPVAPLNPQQTTNRGPDQQFQSTDDKFLTNAFFGSNQDRTEHGNRQWTEDDEMKWQATTKAPYFENKVPGLECTLPASAVLGENKRAQS